MEFILKETEGDDMMSIPQGVADEGLYSFISEEDMNALLEELLRKNVSNDAYDTPTTSTPSAPVVGVPSAPMPTIPGMISYQPSTVGGVTASYQLQGQKVVIPVIELAMPSQGLPACDGVALITVDESPVTPSSPSGTKKRKLYEEDRFSDSQKEKRRRNAVNAKNHRERTKSKIQQLTEKVADVEKERDVCKVEMEQLSVEMNLQHQQVLGSMERENASLRQENASLRQKLKDMELYQELQYGKITLMDWMDLPEDQ